jgi:hypothetical protein
LSKIRPFIVNKKEVGKFSDDKKVYFKYVIASKHFMRKYRGYGITEEVISELDKLSCTRVTIIEKRADETEWVHRSAFALWKSVAVSAAEGGFEMQRFLPIEFMVSTPPGGTEGDII